MRFVCDSHTHTLASGHAYSTILEMARAAADRDLQLLCITDHAPGLPRTTHKDYFYNLKIMERKIDDLDMMYGVELNIMDYQGGIDLQEDILATLDLAIASMHPLCMPQGGTREQYTSAAIKAMENPYVNILGHPDDGRYPLDYERLVPAAMDYHVLLEVNNTSLSPQSYRVQARENLMEMLEVCKRLGAPVTVASDAHAASQVGRFGYAMEVLKAVDFPQELMMNTDARTFRHFIESRRFK